MMPRLSFFMLLAIVLLVVIFFLSPQQMPVILYKLALVTLAAVLGYWLDRHIFPYARPHASEGLFEQGIPMLRRALIVGAAMIAFAIAL